MKVFSDGFRQRNENALKTFREEYAQQHQTKLNWRLHLYGRIMRGGALVVLFFNWKWPVALFVAGYLIQFLGHAIDGTSPSFFRNPKHLLLGSLNHVVRFFEKSDASRSRAEVDGISLSEGRRPKV